MANQQQQQRQFLSSLLSQRGPSSLPYAEDVKWLIRQHLLSLSETFPSLQPKTATFTHNDGRTVNLLQADGTVPMRFQEVTYNIPILIWLVESYPRVSPCVYVNPSRDMFVKRYHPHVNPSGLVEIGYMLNWVYPSSNLVDLVRSLSHAFSLDPPLYAQRRPNLNPNPNQSPYYNSNVNSTCDFELTHSMTSGVGGSPGILPRSYPQQSPHSSTAGGGGSMISPPVLQRAEEDQNELNKRNVMNKLVEMVHGDMVGMRKTREAEIEGLFNVQGVLRQRAEFLSKGLDEMLNENGRLEQQLQMLLMNSDVSEVWLKENEVKLRNLGSLDVDDALVPLNPLSKQMLDSISTDLALEDTIYSLDKAVQEGSVPFDQYLRSVRLLSREQFLHRAMSITVQAVQIKHQVANMAARTSNYAS